MIDVIVSIILLAVITGILIFLRRSKKKGCIGCPYAGKCNGGCKEK